MQYFDVPSESEMTMNCDFLSTTEIVNYITNTSLTRISINVYKIGAVLKSLGFEKKTKRIGSNTKAGYYVLKK